MGKRASTQVAGAWLVPSHRQCLCSFLTCLPMVRLSERRTLILVSFPSFPSFPNLSSYLVFSERSTPFFTACQSVRSSSGRQVRQRMHRSARGGQVAHAILFSILIGTPFKIQASSKRPRCIYRRHFFAHRWHML